MALAASVERPELCAVGLRPVDGVPWKEMQLLAVRLQAFTSLQEGRFGANPRSRLRKPGCRARLAHPNSLVGFPAVGVVTQDFEVDPWPFGIPEGQLEPKGMAG